MLGIGIPAEYGGGGADDPRFAVVLAEECVRAGCTGFGLALAAHGIVASVIAAHGSELARKRWLPGLATGDVLATAVAVNAPLRMANGHLDGVAAAVASGTSAQLLAVSAVADDGPAVTLVDAPTAGLAAGPADEMLALPGVGMTDLAFERAAPAAVLTADAAALLSSDFALALATLAQAGANASLRLTVGYVRERKVFGAPLAGFENTQKMLAEVAVRSASSGALLASCVADLAGGPLPGARAAALVMSATESYTLAVDHGLQLHGGYGYMREYPIAQHYADARLLRLIAVPGLTAHRAIAASIGL